MRIDVAATRKNPGKRYPFEGELALDEDMFDGDKPFRSVTYGGEYYAEGDAIEICGQADVWLHSACDRCGRPMDYELRADLADRFVAEGAETADGDAYTYAGDSIDLAEFIKDKLVLALPVRRLCREDCKGLCPRCGQDLNRGPCGCREQEAEGENPFEALKNWKKSEK